MNIFEKKSTIPAVFAAVVALLACTVSLAGCFSNWAGDEATITINLGGGDGRSIDDPDAVQPSEDLEHTITLSGSGGVQTFTFEKGVKTANITVVPGRYTISVEGYFVVPSTFQYMPPGARLKLAYSVPKEITVIAGKNPPVPIEMKWYVREATPGLKYEPIGPEYTVIGYDGSDPDVTIPSSYEGNPVTQIGENAFAGLTGILSINIPDSIVSVGLNAFSGWTPAQTITVEGYCCEEAADETWGEDWRNNCSANFYYSGPHDYVWVEDSPPTEITHGLEKEVCSYDDTHPSRETRRLHALGTANLDYEEIPDPDDPTKTIAYRVRKGATLDEGVTAIHIPDYWRGDSTAYEDYKPVTQIGSLDDNEEGYEVTLAFSHLAEVTSVTIGENVTDIGTGAFKMCSKLNSVTFGGSVTHIGDYAFHYSGLTDITIPEGVGFIGSSAFRNCTSLARVTIGKDVTHIGDYAFDCCSDLVEVTFAAESLLEKEDIGSDAFPQTGGSIGAGGDNLKNAYNGPGTYVRTPSEGNWGKLSVPVDIDGMSSVEDIKDAIQTALSEGKDVTVTGVGTFTGGEDYNSVNGLNLSIPADRKITWEATYSGYNINISLDSGGKFELTNEGSITGDANGAVLDVSGIGDITVRGTVEATNTTGHGIGCSDYVTITVEDGEIIATEGNAITANNNTTVIIRSGTLTTTGTRATIIVSGNAKLAILGGTIIGTLYPDTAVRARDNSTVYMGGGTIVDNGIQKVLNTDTPEGYFVAGFMGRFLTDGTALSFTLGTDLFEEIPVWVSNL